MRLAVQPDRVDALQFLRLARSSARDDLRAAAALSSGDILEGVAIRDPAFADWLALEQDRFRRAIIDVLDRLVIMESGDAALAAAHRLVALDPLREASQRRLMQAYADYGETGLALRQFDAFRSSLSSELGVEPDAETLALRTRLTNAAGKATAAAAVAAPARSARVKYQADDCCPSLCKPVRRPRPRLFFRRDDRGHHH